MILADLIPAFQGIATKLIPNAYQLWTVLYSPLCAYSSYYWFAFSFLVELLVCSFWEQ